MKKLFLLLATGFICATSIAQENSSVIFLPTAKLDPIAAAAHPVTNLASLYNRNRNGSTERTTTSTTYRDWFDFVGQNTSSTHTGNLFYFEIYPDSTLVDAGNYTFAHGLGMSFDPTDANYYGVFGAPTINSIIDPVVPDTIGFSVDSFAVPFQYMMNHTLAAGTYDSMIIELFATTHVTGSGSTATYDSGTFQLRYSSNPIWTDISADSQARYASVLYTPTASGLGVNETWDSISAVKQRYAIALTSADTVGGIEQRFALSTPLVVNPGRKVVSFVHFKSAVNYTLGTAITAANWMKLFGGTTGSTTSTWPQQTAHGVYYPSYAGSYQTGLVAQNQLRYVYAGDTSGFTYEGHNNLIPGVAFNNPTSNPTAASFVGVTDQAFHVIYTINTLGVANVNKTISNTNASPNPTSSELAVSFNLSAQANVSVTLTNTVGQVVATQTMDNVTGGKASFNTSNLPSGIYFYSVNANGERSSGRVTVAH